MSVSILNRQPTTLLESIFILLESIFIKNFTKKILYKVNLLAEDNSLGLNSLSEQTEPTENFKTLSTISEALSIIDLTGKIIFIDVASEDQKLADKAIKELSSFPSVEITQLNQTDFTKGFQDLENKLKSCDVVITFYKQAPLNWIKERLRFYQVMQVYRNKPLHILVLSSIPNPISIKLPKNATWEILTND